MENHAILPGFISELNDHGRVNLSTQFIQQLSDDGIITMQAAIRLPGMGRTLVLNTSVIDGGGGGYGFSGWICKGACAAAFGLCSAGCSGLTAGIGAAACVAACTLLYDQCKSGC